MADIEADLTVEEIAFLVDEGLASYQPDEELVIFTTKGNAWLSDYCKQRRAEAKKIIPCAGGDGHGL